MRSLVSLADTALARVRELSRRYNRYFLLKHLGVWHTSLHWIAPVSMVVCLGIAAVVLLRRSVGVLPVDQFVYPAVAASVVILLLWIHAQSGAMIPFRPPVRRRLLRLLLLRIACVAAVFLPPVVLGVTLHVHMERVAASKREAQVATPFATATDECLESLKLAAQNPDGTPWKPPPMLDDIKDRLRGLQLSEQILADNEESLTNSSEHDKLQKWIGDYCKDLKTAVRAANENDTAARTANELETVVSTENDETREDPIKPVVERFWRALDTTAPKALRVYMVTHYTFPRQLPRSLMYLLACVCVTFPFLGVWVGYRAIGLVIALWWTMVLALSFIGAMSWLLGQGPVFDALAWGVIALCGLTLVAWPLALSQRVPPRLCLLLLASALIVGPFLPLSVLRLRHDWGENMPAPMLDDPALPSLIMLEFWPGGHPGFGEWEPQIYVAGLAYCCIFLMVVGPTMQRIWASPK